MAQKPLEAHIQKPPLLGIVYPPKSVERSEVLPLYYSGTFDVVPFPSPITPPIADERDRCIQAAMSEKGFADALGDLAPKVDSIASGLWSDQIGLPIGTAYTVNLQGYSDFLGTGLKNGSSLTYKVDEETFELHVVQDVDGTAYVGRGWENGKPKEIIAVISDLKSGQIDMALSVGQRDKSHLQKSVAALTLLQSISHEGFSVQVSGRKADDNWVIGALTNKYKADQGEYDHRYIHATFSRDCVE